MGFIVWLERGGSPSAPPEYDWAVFDTLKEAVEYYDRNPDAIFLAVLLKADETCL